jgi:hypothetical protein
MAIPVEILESLICALLATNGTEMFDPMNNQW